MKQIAVTILNNDTYGTRYVNMSALFPMKVR